MKKLLFIFMALLAFSANASLVGNFNGECKYITAQGKTAYNGKCSYKYEIFKDSDTLTVDVITIKMGNNLVRIVKYPNGAASVNDIPAIARSKEKQTTVTTGENEIFTLNSE